MIASHIFSTSSEAVKKLAKLFTKKKKKENGLSIIILSHLSFSQLLLFFLSKTLIRNQNEDGETHQSRPNFRLGMWHGASI